MYFGPLPISTHGMHTIEKTLYSSSMSGYIEMSGYDYPPSEIEIKRLEGGDLYIGKSSTTKLWTYYLLRGYLDFDTSQLPDDAIVVSAKLYVSVKEDFTGWIYDFNVHVYSGVNQWTDVNSCDWDDCPAYEGIILNTAELLTDYYYNCSIDPNSISLTGRTQFRMTCDERNPPPFPPETMEEIILYRYDDINYKPKLVISYDSPYMPLSIGDLGDLGGGTHPQFFNFDGHVTSKDTALYLMCYKGTAPPEAMYLGDLGGGVPPEFGRFDCKVDSKDTALYLQCYHAGKTVDPPTAYSTSFKFEVPSRIPEDANKPAANYAVLTRLYVPPELCGKNFSLLVNMGNAHNVSLDGRPRTGSPNLVDLGILFGYHILQFTYASSGSSILNFSVVEKDSGQCTWLARFHIYVPNYSDNNYGYVVRTQTYFPRDTYYLGGYADKYISDLWIDGTEQVWSDWEWNIGSYGAIYGWDDGFMYPLENVPLEDLHTMKFTFWNNATGLLDFQYISQSNQPDKIGPPKFYASSRITKLGSHITLNNGKIYAGSQWEFLDKPAISERTHEIRNEYNVSYDNGETWFNAELQLGIGNWWAEWELSAGTTDDVGIPLNLTLINLDSNFIIDPTTLPTLDLRLTNYKIDAYSFPSLKITGMEYNTGDSKNKIDKIDSGFVIATDFGGNIVLTASSFLVLLPGGQIAAVIGSAVGLAMIGASAAIDYYQG